MTDSGIKFSGRSDTGVIAYFSYAPTTASITCNPPTTDAVYDDFTAADMWMATLTLVSTNNIASLPSGSKAIYNSSASGNVRQVIILGKKVSGVPLNIAISFNSSSKLCGHIITMKGVDPDCPVLATQAAGGTGRTWTVPSFSGGFGVGTGWWVFSSDRFPTTGEPSGTNRTSDLGVLSRQWVTTSGVGVGQFDAVHVATPVSSHGIGQKTPNPVFATTVTAPSTFATTSKWAGVGIILNPKQNRMFI